MATIKQKVAVQKIVENHGNVSKSMIQAGYDPDTAKNPKNLTESKGFQELINEYLPDDLILGSLKSDIEAKPRRRIAELTLATKIKGMIVEKQEHSGKMEIVVTNYEDV